MLGIISLRRLPFRLYMSLALRYWDLVMDLLPDWAWKFRKFSCLSIWKTQQFWWTSSLEVSNSGRLDAPMQRPQTKETTPVSSSRLRTRVFWRLGKTDFWLYMVLLIVRVSAKNNSPWCTIANECGIRMVSKQAARRVCFRFFSQLHFPFLICAQCADKPSTALSHHFALAARKQIALANIWWSRIHKGRY